MTLLCTNWEVTKFKPDPKILLRVLNMTASKLARILLTIVLTLMKLVRNKKNLPGRFPVKSFEDLTLCKRVHLPVGVALMVINDFKI